MKHLNQSTMRTTAFLIPIILLSATGCMPQDTQTQKTDSAKKSAFVHDVETVAKPWSHLNFNNDPDAFQFAIVTDRTGGHRPGVFPKAMAKLNLLQPEFVMTVGDLIEGYTEDEAVLDTQWKEIYGFVDQLKMPFFYLPGNHDISNPKMAKDWEVRFGRRYYAFQYRDVLFICLDTQEGAGPIGKKQVEWAQNVLQKHPDVRWTFVLMHQPLWLYEEGNVESARKSIGEGRATGFGMIEKSLEGREYTVFAGHFHQYVKFIRHQQKYFILGTTGGSSQLRGPAFGEFDHAVWVTMAKEGPVIANLMMDGIRDENVHTEKHLTFKAGLKFSEPEGANLITGVSYTLPIENIYSHKMSVALAWEIPAGFKWTIQPPEISDILEPGQSRTFEFNVQYVGKEPYPVLPACRAQFAAGSEYMQELEIPLPLGNFLHSFLPTSVAPKLGTPPVIDGKLDDDCWKKALYISDFRDWRLEKEASAKTSAWIAYDENNFYVAIRCHEPRMDLIRKNTKERDGNVFEGEVVEVFLDTNFDRKTYFHFAVNPEGTLYDALRFDKHALNSNAKVAVVKKNKGWMVELAIPWKDLNVKPDAKIRMGLLLSRDRKGDTRQFLQYPPLGEWNHTPHNFGILTFAE